MKYVICDNCGEKGQDTYIGDLCIKCLPLFTAEMDKVNAAIKEMQDEVKRKFHIIPNKL
jgi:hypothetical protein